MNQHPRVLSEDDLNRLIKLLNMLASNHIGERANAGAMASKMIRDLGLSWREVLKTPQPNDDFQWKLDVILGAYPDIVTERERDFALSVAGFAKPSPKQIAVIDGIVAKVRAYAGRAAA